MTPTTTPAPAGRALRPALAVAAVASMVAGIVHVAAAADHDGDTTLVWLFALTAAAQIGWGVAVAVAVRATSSRLVAGLVINGGALVVWAMSRTVGVPLADVLNDVSSVGRQDGTAALLAGVSALAVARALQQPGAIRPLAHRWVGAMAALAMVGALPALAADHDHGHAPGAAHVPGEDHAPGADHGHDEVAGAEHGDGSDHSAAHEPSAGVDGHGAGDAHSDPTTHVLDAVHDRSHESAHVGGHGDAVASPHGHAGAPDPSGPSDPHPHPTDPTEHPIDPTDPTDPHEHPTDPTDPTDPGPITSIDDPRLTPEQFDAAVQLIVSVAAAMSSLATEEDVLAAGYTSIGDGTEPGDYEHFVKWSYLGDAFELDPAHIESVVMKINADGTKRVVSAMYILTLGKTMADVPDIAGELTTWHDHDNLCFSGTQLVALAVNGVCPAGVLVNTPPMLHVWVEANPCGPFAAIDEHGVTCDTEHAH